MNILRRLFGWFGGNTEWLVLLAMSSVAAWLYVDGMMVRRDRDSIMATADVVCAAAGADFAASATVETAANGKRVTVPHPRGALCLRSVRGLASFQAETIRSSAETLATAMRQRDEKSTSDIARAASDSRAARDATLRMEKADAAIDHTNRVDGRWFGALNDVAGLRKDD